MGGIIVLRNAYILVKLNKFYNFFFFLCKSENLESHQLPVKVHTLNLCAKIHTKNSPGKR